MNKILRSIFFIIYFAVCTVVSARELYVKPQWYVGKSDFREAVIDKDGYLTDAYNRINSDTVNVFDINTQGEYSLNVSFNIKNLHNKPFTRYAQYTYNDKGKVKRAGRVERPIYGWVWGMKDMLHYNAVWMRAAKIDDTLYGNNEVEFCVVSINGADTTYHVDWRNCHYLNSAQSSDTYAMWIQYNNNTAWIGGGWSLDIPWATVYNIQSFGSLTGLYLGSASQVRVENVFVTVEEKDMPRRTDWTTASLNDYFNSGRMLAPIEGFWHFTTDKERWDKTLLGGNYEFAIVANGDSYDVIYLSGAEIHPGRWIEGTVKASFRRSNNRYYEGYWYDAEGIKMEKVFLYPFAQRLNIEFATENLTIPMLPSKPVLRNETTDVAITSQGTGFALTSDGYIITNHHVVEGGYEFYVHFDSSLGLQPYRAELVTTDSVHDLAILRINDADFTTLGDIPYCISNENIRAGEDIFYLGYPQASYIGNDIKYAVGNVSAVNGLARYNFMMSVDVDSGSSGSPVFNADGDVVGIVRSILNEDVSRLTASYAIKMPFLYRLIEQLPSPISLPENKIKELSQPDKIEAITPYIFRIEALIR